MPVPLDRAIPVDPFEKVGYYVVEYLKRATASDPITKSHCEENSHGVFTLLTGSNKHKFTFSELTSDAQKMDLSLKALGAALKLPTDFVEELIKRGASFEEARDEMVKVAARELGVSGPVAVKSDAGPITIADLPDYIFDPERPIEVEQHHYPDFFSAGDLALWLGEEKHRKSNLVLQFLICAAIGRPFLNFKFEGQPLRVVLIDYETSSSEMSRRRVAIVTAMKLTAEEIALLDRNLLIIEVRRIEKAGRVFPKFPHRPSAQAHDEQRQFWEGLVARYRADLYVIDPLRKFHASDENDSRSESLLSEMRRVFKSGVIFLHHMRKTNEDGGQRYRSLVKDMRAWSDGSRGSSAFKAHVDRIICQERIMQENGDEVVHLGAFGKSGADITPFPLIESDHESFCFVPEAIIPEALRKAFDALKAQRRPFNIKADAAAIIQKATLVGRATAFRRVDDLMRHGLLLQEENGSLKLAAPGGE